MNQYELFLVALVLVFVVLAILILTSTSNSSTTRSNNDIDRLVFRASAVPVSELSYSTPGFYVLNVPSNVTRATVTLYGGGGGGAAGLLPGATIGGAGGGGASTILEYPFKVIPGTRIGVQVGEGGAGGTSGEGGQGGDSWISYDGVVLVTAFGGGGGIRFTGGGGAGAGGPGISYSGGIAGPSPQNPLITGLPGGDGDGSNGQAVSITQQSGYSVSGAGGGGFLVLNGGSVLNTAGGRGVQQNRFAFSAGGGASYFGAGANGVAEDQNGLPGTAGSGGSGGGPTTAEQRLGGKGGDGGVILKFY